MIKNKKLIVGMIFLSNGLPLASMQPNLDLEIKEFNLMEDAAQAEGMLQENCSELFANPKFNILAMLSNKTITPQVSDSHNSLIMQVLKYKKTILSFLAYEKTYPNAFIRLLVTSSHERRNGYASILLNNLFDSMMSQKFGKIAIETREQNAPAVAFYEKLLRSRNDISYSKTPVSVPNKAITDVIRYEISFN